MNSNSGLANGVSRAARAKMRSEQSDGIGEKTTTLSSKDSQLQQRPTSLQAKQSRQDSQQQQPVVGNSNNTKLVFGLSSRTNRLKHDEYAEKRLNQAVSNKSLMSDTQHSTTTASNKSPQSAAGLRPTRLGNFYRPPAEQQQQQQQSVDRSPARSDNLPARSDRSPARGERSPVRKAPLEVEIVEKKTSAEREQKPASSKKSHSVELQSKKPLVEELLAHKEPPKPLLASSSSISETSKKSNSSAVKMQFNIPPPPQIQSATNRSSVVSLAKARIYNRQPVAQPQPPGSAGHSPLLEAQTIPDSILSGFKPPRKQVNVSKACEKWEGGEPFAKTKSRQRLAQTRAASAAGGHRKLLGTWSMTSVVVTQQLQLQQQALAANSTGVSSGDADQPSVKILTRGSVLERVQQFEKAPQQQVEGRNSARTTPTQIPSSPAEDREEKEQQQQQQSGTREIEITIGPTPIQLVQESSSAQAAYKTRVSSIQNSTAATGARNQDQQVAAQTNTTINRLRRRSSTSTTTTTTTTATNSTQIIPKFYHPNGKPPNTYDIELQKKNIAACFDNLPDRKAQLTGVSARRHFHSIALACGFSEYFKEPLCLYVRHQFESNSNLLHSGAAGNHHQPVARKQSQANLNGATVKRMPLTKAASIDTSTMDRIQKQTFVTCDQFLTCWRQLISCCFDQASRFVHLLTMGQRNHLLPDDLVPLVQSVIEDHPGLKFLRAAPDFHLRYIQTVIARIFYCLNKSWTGKISVTELRQSNLLAVLQVLSQEEDINQITDYFSYEHFYVIYCKFWALDTDHDLLISRDDLAKHNDAAISSRIIDRIFSGIVSKHVQSTGKMSYSDFVWFLLAEEDKKHPRAIEYWFRLMDLDGDGYISLYEMEYFYYEQSKRLELMNIEALPFLDSQCQILDLVSPKEANKISLSDLKRTKMATIFFDTFINLEKYLEHESREFVSNRDLIGPNGTLISDWDRYASEEYESLVSSEESTV